MNKKILQIIMISLLLKFIGCKPEEKNHSQISDKMQTEESVHSDLFTPQYQLLTRGILEKTSNDDLAAVVYDNITLRMKKDQKDDHEFVSSLSEAQQAIFSTMMVEAEVNNGGFDQFYTNSSSQFAEMAVDGFRLIGAQKFADLMEKVNRFYAENQEKIEAYWDESQDWEGESYEENPLNKFDEKFYALYQEENLIQLKVDYIRNHTQQFVQEDICKQYEGMFECKEDSATMKVVHLGNKQYKVIFEGKHYVNDRQVRNMTLIPDKRTLYFEKNEQAGGLIYSEDFNSVEAVGGSNERPIYTRMD